MLIDLSLNNEAAAKIKLLTNLAVFNQLKGGIEMWSRAQDPALVSWPKRTQRESAF